MRWSVIIFCLVIGLYNANCSTNADNVKSTSAAAEPTAAATAATQSAVAIATTLSDTAKDKRQIGAKDEAVYAANHRADTNVADDPENPQETIYGPKPNQFIIRPIAPHQHQQHEDHQQPPQLRNYPATIRPHGTQLLEQSQEIQHFAYLQDISRNHPKSSADASELAGKPHAPQSKKPIKSSRATTYRTVEEAEQRYAVAIQPPIPSSAQPPLYHTPRYHLPPGARAPQPTPSAGPSPYQIIPEEQFLKLLEEELQARAYHDALQYRHQQQQEQQVQQQQQQQQQAAEAAAKAQSQQQQQPSERSGAGLGSYRHQQSIAEEQPGIPPEYVQYVPRHRGGPKYLPLSAHAQQPQVSEPQATEPEQAPPGIPPQLAYYQPQISYKTLPNHPLAKSSLENEIEKLLAANKPPGGQLVDNSNEPSAVVHHHHQPPPPQQLSRPHVQPKIYSTPTNPPATPTPLVDANNQPFIPSLFKFSNFQPPTPIYPTQVPPQHVIDAKKLGPVVYPPTQPTLAQPQPTQYYYQELAPSPRPKAYRAKQYGAKVSSGAGAAPKLREKEPPNYPTVPTTGKYAAPLYYEFDRPSEAHAAPAQFHPSPPDPNTPAAGPQHGRHGTQSDSPHVRQFQLPSPSPSQSSIYVSQGTGIATPSHPSPVKAKSVNDVRQLRLPQPGGKPLTQAEFQALVDAGYPVTAVPVPVPVPYEQYVKDHPEYRDQPMDYAHVMQRIAQQYSPRKGSEPSVKILSSPSEPQQTATAIGGGSVTYLRPIAHGEQKRHPREEKDTAVEGMKEDTKK